MANITDEQLFKIIKIISEEKSGDGGEDAAKAAEEAKAREEAEAQAKAAEEAAAAEANAKAKKPEDEDEDKDEDKEVDSVAVERENKYIAKTLRAELRSNGIDEDLVDSLTEFIAYDTLKNEDGEADDEKVEKFAEAVSGIANRKPPKGKSAEHDILNPKKEGLGRYLPNNDK